MMGLRLTHHFVTFEGAYFFYAHTDSRCTGQTHRQQKSAQEIRTAIIHGPWANAGSSNQ
jgi:hypothetical protein